MASKYAKYKGKVPLAQVESTTERDQEIAKIQVELKDHNLAQLAAVLTGLRGIEEKLTSQLKTTGYHRAAVEELILNLLDAGETDAVSTGGHTLSTKFEPYPQVDDKAALLKHCLDDEELRETLSLNPQRLASMIREEAENNLLQIEEKEIDKDGEKVVVQEARSSQLPGVRVFLKRTLSRVKARSSAD